MKKFLLLICINFFLFNVAKSQDTLGLKFGFGMLRGKVYSYELINQDISKNTQDAPLGIIQDTVIAEIELIMLADDGYGMLVTFKPIEEGAELPDAIYSIPLQIALDTNGNTLGMINHAQYQEFLFEQVDSFYELGEYDSLTMKGLKYRLSSTKYIETLVYRPFESFFAAFGKQYRPAITYLVGKEIFHPFSKEPFVAAGQTAGAELNAEKGLYYSNTNIKNTVEERQILIQEYQNFLKRQNAFDPNVVQPAIDVGFMTIHLMNRKLGVINYFKVAETLRVGEEIKESTTVMRLITIKDAEVPGE